MTKLYRYVAILSLQHSPPDERSKSENNEIPKKGKKERLFLVLLRGFLSLDNARDVNQA